MVRALRVNHTRLTRRSYRERLAIRSHYQTVDADISDYAVVWARAHITDPSLGVPRLFRLDILAKSPNARRFVYGRFALSNIGIVHCGHKWSTMFTSIHAQDARRWLANGGIAKTPDALRWHRRLKPRPQQSLQMLKSSSLVLPPSLGAACRLNTQWPGLEFQGIIRGLEEESLRSPRTVSQGRESGAGAADTPRTIKQWIRMHPDPISAISYWSEDGYLLSSYITAPAWRTRIDPQPS
jgi:hypothetical protein